MKLLNYYANPSRRRRAHKALIKALIRIRQAEPDVQIILSGDFNHDLSAANDTEHNQLRDQLLTLHNNPLNTFKRTNAQSKIDFHLTTKGLETSRNLIVEGPSDHHVLMCSVYGISMVAIKSAKQMIYSSLANEPKAEHVSVYLTYILTLLNLAHRHIPWKAEKIRRIRQKMLAEIPIIKFNSPKNIYSLEEKIQDLLLEGAPFEEINTELNKLRKYSYQSYIETNLKVHKTEPKKYHAAL